LQRFRSEAAVVWTICRSDAARPGVIHHDRKDYWPKSCAAVEGVSAARSNAAGPVSRRIVGTSRPASTKNGPWIGRNARLETAEEKVRAVAH